MTRRELVEVIGMEAAEKLCVAGKIIVTIRGAEHVIPMEEAEELRDALDVALAGPGPQVVCEVVERR